MQVLVVDDDTQILDTLRRGLSYAGHRVRTAASGAAALAEVQLQPPQLLLLDWQLPDMSGMEVLRRLDSKLDFGVIMLTSRRAPEDKVEGLDSGADDYVVKPYNLDELLARMRAVVRRHDGAGEQGLQVGDLRLNSATRQASFRDQPLDLIGKEFALLELLMRNPRQVLSRDLIAAQVWQEGCSDNSIEVCVSHLRGKLKSAGAAEMLMTVRGAGYMLREPQSN